MTQRGGTGWKLTIAALPWERACDCGSTLLRAVFSANGAGPGGIEALRCEVLFSEYLSHPITVGLCSLHKEFG